MKVRVNFTIDIDRAAFERYWAFVDSVDGFRKCIKEHAEHTLKCDLEQWSVPYKMVKTQTGEQA